MSYKILYIEDQNAETIELEFENRGFEVEVYKPDKFDEYIRYIHRKDFDAYIMDFRLTEGHGLVDAPTYAATQRTFGDNRKERPIILITNEENLPLFKNDFTSQDLFDIVLSKVKLRSDYDKYSERIKDLVDAYKSIQDNKFEITSILKIDTIEDLDYRFTAKLYQFKEKNDIYGYCRTILNSLIRAVGPLVGKDVLAARLGIDSVCKDFEKLLQLDEFENCRYNGIMSKSYDRWWFDKIKLLWDKVNPGSLRRLNAEERVSILKQRFRLNLQPAKPIKNASSSNFWTICHETKKPLDPIEGYHLNIRHLDEWLEPDYVSLNAVLEDARLNAFLSPLDKKEILILGNEITRQNG